MITDGEGAEVEGKGADQISADIYSNWIFTSNHKDGIRKTANDRRYCMLYCAQNDADDLVRDGLDEAYFTRFAGWLQQEDGRAIAAEYLRTFAIPERYDPTKGALRAPATSSTTEALAAGRDELSQMLVDHVADETEGFRGGWVSHARFAAFAASLHQKPSRVKVAKAIESQGYQRCPVLTDGRTNDPVLPDGIKTVLWVKKGSQLLSTLWGKTAAEIPRMSVAAQSAARPATTADAAGSPLVAGSTPTGVVFGAA
jgi:hypothetical protein